MIRLYENLRVRIDVCQTVKRTRKSESVNDDLTLAVLLSDHHMIEKHCVCVRVCVCVCVCERSVDLIS